MHPTRLYFDNAATSWPKPTTVYDAVDRYQRELGAPSGRGTYREAVTVERLILECRKDLARLIGANDPRRIIFTANGTDSLNTALLGVLRPGDHVVTSVAEHNSVLRPLRHLESNGVEVSRVGCDQFGRIQPDDIQRAMRANTKLIAVTHASNVTGALQPIAEIGQIAKAHERLFLVDAAQSLGHVPIDVGELQIDLLAAPGHKGLLGPLGTGVLYIAEEVEKSLVPLRHGGTGTHSELDEQPASLPERYEAGNLNVPGIVGLGAAVKELLTRGIGSIREHEQCLSEQLGRGLLEIDGITVFGPCAPSDRLGVFSVVGAGYDPHEIASLLDTGHSIQVRAGLHCAPRMHESLGTIALGGTVRFSLGLFHQENDVERLVSAMRELMAGA